MEHSTSTGKDPLNQLLYPSLTFRDFVNEAPIGLYVVWNKKYYYINTVFQKVLGYTEEEMTQKEFWETVHPDAQEKIRNMGMARLRGEDVPSHYEVIAIRKDGSECWIEIYVGKLEIDGETILLVAALDITEKKMMEEQLELSEARYRLIIDEQNETVIRFSADGVITFVNEAVSRHFRIQKTDLLGQPVSTLLNLNEQESLDQILAKIQDVDSYLRFEQKRTTSDCGFDIWIEWVIKTVRNVNADIVEYQVVGRDITLRKLAEMQLKNANDELERKVQERTAELQKYNQELAALNRTLNNIVANMSDAVLLVNEQNQVEIMNLGAQKQYEGLINKLRRELINDLNSRRTSLLKELLEKGSGFRDRELTFSTDDLPLSFLVSGVPIGSEAGKKTVWMLMVRPIKEIHDLVNRFIGARATFTFADIGTANLEIEKLKELANQAAKTNSNVVIEGESGTGKELFAQAIHNASRRREGPFIAVNCGAIPRDLIASELFGYAEGAFTGAKKGGNPGKFELADGGTLFLDEIGDMPIEQQVALLRVIQDQQITRIGDKKIIRVDVRIICATNKNLAQEVRKGNFRQDLYYRLNVFSIKIPPLRERVEDIPILFEHFVKQLAPHMEVERDHNYSAVICRLQEYDWPGNVRELQNIVERMVNASKGMPRFDVNHIPAEVASNTARAIPSLPNVALSNLKGVIKDAEKLQIINTLAKNHGNVTKTAQEMGVSRRTLQRKMKEYGIRPRLSPC